MREKAVRIRCRVPECEGHVLPGRNKYRMCHRHEEWQDFVLFSLNEIITISRESKTGKVGIVLPGNPEYDKAAEKIRQVLAR